MEHAVIAKKAQEAGRVLASLEAWVRSAALSAIHKALETQKSRIFSANAIDLEKAKLENLSPPLLKRLKFDGPKLDEVVAGLLVLEQMEDPLFHILQRRELDRNLILEQVTVPIGCIAFVFESRPDALVQMAALALRSGNAVLLKGGREALETNRVITSIIQDASYKAGIPAGWLELFEQRSDVEALLGLHEYIDLIIPRGSNAFVQHIMENRRIPVLGHADGICHAYIHREADIQKAVGICVDSKTQYVAVCNAVETILIDEAVLETALVPLALALAERGVELRVCEKSLNILSYDPATRGLNFKLASESDWKSEYLDYIVSIKAVASETEAISHINVFGSHHTDTIITENSKIAEFFLRSIDSSSVFWNASTRFADGFKYGLGAEVGISTGKIHARGPMGVEGLLTYKWLLRGDGQIVADYAAGKKSFTHRNLKNTGDTES